MTQQVCYPMCDTVCEKPRRTGGYYKEAAVIWLVQVYAFVYQCVLLYWYRSTGPHKEPWPIIWGGVYRETEQYDYWVAKVLWPEKFLPKEFTKRLRTTWVDRWLLYGGCNIIKTIKVCSAKKHPTWRLRLPPRNRCGWDVCGMCVGCVRTWVQLAPYKESELYDCVIVKMA